ncbi:20394_t:CDS:2 [Dentiscutata erythropus]|uniref:20394_t:CDS:1 n=1 Tax=Dentiscutata erythropus TaxID=1348616 RepID=A0A9N9C5E8_9GLOM|nr:20394_t:CDS:2 [Dentiscutata erythropus]
MPETKGFQTKGKKVIFRELRHCIQNSKVRQKQRNSLLKKPHSLRVKNTECMATIHLRLEHWHLHTTHPLEIGIKFIHNHVVHSAESLSFRRIKDDIRNQYLELFVNSHLPATALQTFEDNLYLRADNDLVQLLADCAQNPDYEYVLHLFKQYCNKHLGGQNGVLIFEHLREKVNHYNNSGKGCAILQEYNSLLGKRFLCPSWDAIDAEKIQQTKVFTEYLVPSQKSNNSFVEAIKHDYENCGPELQTALNKFAKQYNMAKAKSVPALTTFLYNINHNTNPLVYMRSGAKIHMQVESVK